MSLRVLPCAAMCGHALLVLLVLLVPFVPLVLLVGASCCRLGSLFAALVGGFAVPYAGCRLLVDCCWLCCWWC